MLSKKNVRLAAMAMLNFMLDRAWAAILETRLIHNFIS
jgi:hypothetical protein